jgi:hypothetical protein
MPKCKPTPEPRALTPAEAKAFIAAAQPHRLGPMLTTMVSVGSRPGESAGLRGDDVDVDAGTLAVTGSMKRNEREGGGYDLIRGPVKKSTGASERSGSRRVCYPCCESSVSDRPWSGWWPGLSGRTTVSCLPRRPEPRSSRPTCAGR